MKAKTIQCEEIWSAGQLFTLPYDVLVIATGAKSNTFGVPGVGEHANVYFLKQLEHARAIRNRILECFERACNKELPEEERRRLLSFVVVGAGPTSVEFTAELYDFLESDVRKWFGPDLHDLVSVTLVEASDHILGAFDAQLTNYVTRLFKRRRINVLTDSVVKEISNDSHVCLVDGRRLPFGLAVWSTGLQQVKFVERLDNVEKDRSGRLVIDEGLRLAGAPRGVFAIGDCAVDKDLPLPPIAQVAQQQAEFLAKALNESGIAADGDDDEQHSADAFRFWNLGSFASVGGSEAILDETHTPSGVPKFRLKGFAAFVCYRAAYWSMSVSVQNKLLIPMYWFKSFVFGRDTSRF